MVTMFGTNVDKTDRNDDITIIKKSNYLETERLSFNSEQKLRANRKRG